MLDQAYPTPGLPDTTTETNTPKGMTDLEFKNLVGNEIKDALAYVDAEIAPARTQNYEYFLGNMDDVPATEGRSTVVVRVVADYIGFMLPSLLRTMISGKKIVEYSPKGEWDEAAAKQATEYVNDVVMRVDNKIEQTAYGWGFDGLVNKVGVVKVWWEEKKETKDLHTQGLNDLQLVMQVIQAEQQGLEIVAHEQVNGLHSLVLRQTTDVSHVKFDILPPEEFIISRDARSLEGGRLKSHRRYQYAGDLVAQGYDPAVIARLPTYFVGNMSPEAQARQPTNLVYSTNSPDPMLRRVAVHEGTILCDKDGTGLKEWYFVAAGWAGQIEVLRCEEFEDQLYFCDFCPVPLPHLFFGRCPADDLIEIQRIQTVLARQTMDNIYLTNAPQQEVVVNQIIGQRIEYVQNKSPGGIIPVTAAGTVNNVTIPFMAGSSLELMNYWDQQAENRTGASRNNAGLDPEVLQNQSATAAMLQSSASQLKMETIARIWASGGMRKLGRAILRILKRRQSFARMVRMNGQMQQVDPQAWAQMEDWDVSVNTGLGTGNRDRDLQMGTMILGKMEQIIKEAGPMNPIVTLPMYSHALVAMAEAAGFNNAEQYFKPLPLDWQPPPPPPPQPDPKVQVAQIQAGATIEAAQIKAGSDQSTAQIDNMINFLLGIREQNLEAQLKATEIAVDHHKNENLANIAKVKGQMH